MSNTYTIAKIILVSLALVSCGVKKNSSLSFKDSQSYLKASKVQKSCIDEQNLPVFSDANSLINEITSISNSYGLSYLSRTNQYMVNNGHQGSPLIFGKEVIVNYYKELQSIFNTAKESSFVNANWTELVQKKDYLANLINRWSFHQCHLTNLVTNKNQKYSDFLSIEAQFCKEDCLISKDNRLLSKTEKEIRSKVINTCSLYKRKNLCSIEYDYAVIKKKRDSFIQDTLIRARKDFVKSLYGIKSTAVDINCSRSGSKTTLEIPMVGENLNLVNSIKKYWETENLSLKFIRSVNGLEIQPTSEAMSYVASNKPSTIVLSNQLFGVQKDKTIAHEFGHILGFKDCYIEYYDGDSEEIIYFELEREQGNLMCSLMSGNNIPKKYTDSLINKFCE